MSLSAQQPGTWASSGRESPTDPHFADVVNLSHFDGTNGSQTYVDSSSQATNIPQGGGGGALSTSQFKWGSASVSGSIGSSGNAIYNIGTADYTMEFWVYTTSLSAAQNVLYWDVASGGPTGIAFTATAGLIHIFVNNIARITGSGITINTWHFIAYNRTSGTGTLYLDGTSQGTWADTFNYTGDSLYVCCYSGFVSDLIGNIDDLRFTIGVGRYPSSCAVPTAPFPNH